MKSNSDDIKELKAVIIGETFTRHLFPLNEKINEITALVDFYKLAGKSYQLVSV